MKNNLSASYHSAVHQLREELHHFSDEDSDCIIETLWKSVSSKSHLTEPQKVLASCIKIKYF